MNKTRILFLVNSLEMGGVEKGVWSLLKNFSVAKYDITVYCLFVEGILAEDVRRLGIPVINIGANFNKRIDLKTLFKLTRIIKATKPDIIRSHAIYSNRYANLAARLAGFKNVISSLHSIYNFPITKKAYLFDSFCLSWCRSFIVSSEAMKKHCLSRFKIKPSKVKIISQSIDLKSILTVIEEDKFKLKEELEIGDNDCVLVTIGRLVEAKGYSYLIEAMKNIIKDIPNIILLVIGDGPLKEQLITLSRGEGLSKHIKFLGQKKNVYPFLAIGDLFVSSSIREGFGVVFLEAMAMSLPIVSTDVGISQWLLNKEGCECGVIVPSKDPLALAQAITDLINNPQKRSEMGKRGLSRIEKDFTVEREINSLETLFDSIGHQ